MPQLQQKITVEKTIQQGKYYLVSLHEPSDCATVPGMLGTVAQAFDTPVQEI